MLQEFLIKYLGSVISILLPIIIIMLMIGQGAYMFIKFINED